MLNIYQRQIANRDLKKIIRDYQEGYIKACAASRDAYMKTLAPGAAVPQEGRIYRQTEKDEFKSKCNGYKALANAALDGLLNTLGDAVTAAPSTDAVNAITLLSMRANADKKDFERLLTKYGENVQAYKTIVSIAHDRGVDEYPRMHPEEATLDSIENLRATLNSALTLENAEAGRAGAFMSMVASEIDEALPVD
jgi:hypothetical protein